MTGAQIVHQALETRTLHSAACGSSQIFVDHLYLRNPQRRATSTSSYCRR